MRREEGSLGQVFTGKKFTFVTQLTARANSVEIEQTRPSSVVSD